MLIRCSRVRKLMETDNLDLAQASRVIRDQNIMHQMLRRNPRAADYRFGREF